MPTEQKANRHHRRSRSDSGQKHRHSRERRPYEKDKPDRYDKYSRNSRSRTPPRQETQKSKYTLSYQSNSDRRYYQSHRENANGKYYEGSTNKNYDNASNRHYDGGAGKRDPIDKRLPEKGQEHSNKPKFSRYEELDSSRNRDKIPNYDKKGRGRSTPERQHKRRRISSSRSVSISPKKPTKYEAKPVPSIKSPPERIKEQEPIQKYQKLQQPEKEKPQPASFTKMDKQPDAVEHRIMKQFADISPIKRQSFTEFKQAKQEEPIPMPILKNKVNKFDIVVNFETIQISEARQNLAITPPPSSFLLLETFRTMNKFQVETLDPKWAAFLKKDMDKYAQARQATMSKLGEPTQTITEDGRYIFGKQHMWMKESRNEQELDLRFCFQEFKLHNANLSEYMRKIRFLD